MRMALLYIRIENLANATYPPHIKPDNNPLHINILSNHPPNIMKNLQGSISKGINTLSSEETTFKNKSKDSYNNTFAKSWLKHIIISTAANTSTVANKGKNRKKKDFMV